MRILIISAYHGGSHKSWATGYRQYSAHDVQLLTLPARFWKWRMHGGAITLARRFRDRIARSQMAIPDLLLFTDMVDVSTFMALIRRDYPTMPALLYMHENQLTYPLPGSPGQGPMRRQKGERDLHYAFVNFVSMLVADKVYFNSDYHRQELFDALPNYLRHFPEYNELNTLPSLRAKSGVLPPGIDIRFLRDRLTEPDPDLAPLVIWNQRWEFDKDPAAFFEALVHLSRAGERFRLAVCGERFSREPSEFASARVGLQDHVVHWGYAPREEYARLLWRASITVSTALHEFFGISILEAMYCQNYTILPNRLSYPDILPAALHDQCLYEDNSQLQTKLRWSINNPEQARTVSMSLSEAAAAYDWRRVAARYDEEFEGLL
jgi:glycosyltransferase involved in cell wall biosynthesis